MAWLILHLLTYMQSLLGILFALQVVFTAFQTTTQAIHTKLSLASGLLNIIATFAAAVLSFAEDQRTVRPSDVLVIYFSAISILYIPRLRTLWLIPSITACQSLWTAVYIFTVAILVVESAKKTKFLRRLHQPVTPEQSGSFWSQNLFIWVLPFFHQGYLKHLQLEDIPEVDEALAGDVAEHKLQTAWDMDRRLLYATFRAYRWSFLSGIPPRLALTAFTFAQPFLITTLVDWMGATEPPENYGPALIGAVILVYSGLAVCLPAFVHSCI
jgi:ATP-binding cassette, subfamily C (CFTR/MRP), member 1